MLGCVDLISREAKIHPERKLLDMAENLAIIGHCGTWLSVLMENLLSQASQSSVPTIVQSLQMVSGGPSFLLCLLRRVWFQVNVREMCKSVLAVLQALAYQKDLSIEMDVGEEVPEYSELSRGSICQVMINLGANAVK